MPRQAPVIDGVPPYERNWPVDPVPGGTPGGASPGDKGPLLLSSAKPGAGEDAIGAIIAAAQTTTAAPAPVNIPAAQPKKAGQPTDEQAEADGVIDAILADMKKAQRQ
jgi:hypothetical protein